MGSIPCEAKHSRSFGSCWREITTISTLPVSSTAVAPMSISTPFDIGPRFLNWPLVRFFTVPVTVSGWPLRPRLGMSSLPPSGSVTRAPTPAFCISITAAGS